MKKNLSEIVFWYVTAIEVFFLESVRYHQNHLILIPFFAIFLGRVSMNDAQVRVLSDLVQVYSKNTVQACQDIIAENGKIINPFYLR